MTSLLEFEDQRPRLDRFLRITENLDIALEKEPEIFCRSRLANTASPPSTADLAAGKPETSSSYPGPSCSLWHGPPFRTYKLRFSFSRKWAFTVLVLYLIGALLLFWYRYNCALEAVAKTLGSTNV
jgi:hypothetical protein